MARRYIVDVTIVKRNGEDIQVYHKYQGQDQVDITPFIKLTTNGAHIIKGQKQIFDFGFRTYKSASNQAEFINELGQEYNENDKYKKFATIRKFYFK